MKRNNEVFAILQMLAHIFDLVCVHVRHGVRNRDRQVDDDLAVGRGLPNIDNGVANLDGIVGFGAGKAFGRIFKGEVAGRFSGIVV